MCFFLLELHADICKALKQLPAFASDAAADMAKDTANALIAFGSDVAKNHLQSKPS
jgi:hypothetical protein